MYIAITICLRICMTAGVCIMQCFLYYRASPGHRAIGSYIARSVEVMHDLSIFNIRLDLISRSEKKSKDTSSRWTSANS